MTKSEFDRLFSRFKIDAYNYIFANAPRRTGNLQRSIRYEEIDGGFRIIIDISYMVYTEEKWGYNKHWGKTLQNPNYKWLQNSVYNLAIRFAERLKGVVVV